ncbi:hypothetical protein P152DRAFT_504882 [Eremomyces bilateralis CBS 781.70]|uniref:Heterokaryon incompatibility domain-containing protein n=1 Tax=Eremomyces bilateralis CBS 781.70 TaxID=1392243 RepID=A0A6G1GE07_9PEZI|nr:uncharacterized protein P152DRAFT_504882 [Eremomyces bilateralis CBS 781.70]KAF1816121.1 hypothetical protein P152DRAFT_504882 [Eremomyces bilateralis CBS 781.70]
MDQHQEHRNEGDLYETLPLNPFEIRMLVLEPATDQTGRIECKLECCPLAPDLFSRIWESVSYTWDSLVGTEGIRVNGFRRLVTPNLAAFLRRRRDSKNNITLWVDAICINQANLKEKERQIPMMGMIYAASPLLNIWLGPEQDDSDMAMDELWNLGSGSPYDKMPILSGRTLKALELLLSRPWWSRVWILQEVLFGAAGRKLGEARVWCGSMNIPWLHVTIAAVRMQSHKDDMRQYFPAIDNILVLESLRDQAGSRVTAAAGAASREAILELVSRFRGFRSTDPRDKIYALLGMLFREAGRQFTEISPTYTATVEDVFTSFALYMLQGGSKLSILRQCHGHLIKGLPLWVPDWSFSSSALPLPSKCSTFRPNAPWWTQSFKDPDDKDKNMEMRGIRQLRVPGFFGNDQERESEEIRRFKELRLASGGIRMVGSNDRLPKAMEGLGPEAQDLAKKLIASKSLLCFDASEDLYGKRFREYEDKDASKQGEEGVASAILRLGERATQRRENLAVLDALSPAEQSFMAAAQTKPLVQNLDSRTLAAQGFLWDIIDEVCDVFPASVDADWQDATRFMVSVGRCKEMALKNPATKNPYYSPDGKCEAFWLTMFAGQTERRGDFGKMEDMRPLMRFEHWLPEVPEHWLPTEPRVTVTSTGRLAVADFSRRSSIALTEYIRSKLGSDIEIQSDMPGVEMHQNLLPKEWTAEDVDLHKKQFNDLGSLWQEQPYDLYHLPFNLPSTIPDPYWEVRAQEDSLALLKNREYSKPMEIFYGVNHQLLSTPEMQEITDQELKKSEGSFLITKEGYFGLAPKEAKTRDRVIVLFGLDVPLVCRKNENSGYKVVGESYVHGLMSGELIEKWENGQIEAGTISLQ